MFGMKKLNLRCHMDDINIWLQYAIHERIKEIFLYGDSYVKITVLAPILYE